MGASFRISEAASLALHGTVLLASRNGRPVTSKAIAQMLGASAAHTGKVLQLLARYGLLRSERGPAGGFRLAHPAETITLLHVYEAIEGPLTPRGCLLSKPACRGAGCILGDLPEKADRQLRARLANTTLAELTQVFSDCSAPALGKSSAAGNDPFPGECGRDDAEDAARLRRRPL